MVSVTTHKICVCLAQTGEIVIHEDFITSGGGLVSSHSAVVSSLGISCGLTCGFDSAEFAICFVVAVITLLDAGGVRYTTGKMSRFLNNAISNEEVNGEKFNENLGHTVSQILLGVLLGIAVSTITHICL